MGMAHLPLLRRLPSMKPPFAMTLPSGNSQVAEKFEKVRRATFGKCKQFGAPHKKGPRLEAFS